MHSLLPFVIFSFPAPQCYNHFNDKRQKEESQEPVAGVVLHISHPPDPGKRHEDEQSSSNNRPHKLEQLHHAGFSCVQCSQDNRLHESPQSLNPASKDGPIQIYLTGDQIVERNAAGQIMRTQPLQT